MHWNRIQSATTDRKLTTSSVSWILASSFSVGSAAAGAHSPHCCLRLWLVRQWCQCCVTWQLHIVKHVTSDCQTASLHQHHHRAGASLLSCHVRLWCVFYLPWLMNEAALHRDTAPYPATSTTNPSSLADFHDCGQLQYKIATSYS